MSKGKKGKALVGTARMDAEEDAVMERVAAGAEMVELAKEYGIHRATLYRWFTATDERAKKYEVAKRLSAYQLAQEAGQILDDLAEVSAEELTAPQVTLAAKRSDYRRWLAGIRNQEFADKGVAVNQTLNIGQLHLDALRQSGSPKALPGTPKQLEGEVIDAEVIEEEG